MTTEARDTGRPTDRGRQLAWLMPLTGLAFLLIAIAAVIISDGGPNTNDDSAAEVVQFYATHQGRTMASVILALIAITALAFFAGYLRSVMRARERVGAILSTIAYAGLLILAIGIAFDATITLALRETADNIEPAAAQALAALWNNDFIPMAFGTTLFLLATGLWVIQHAGLLPKWVGYLMIVLAVVTFTPAGFISFLAAGVLVAVISVVLALQARKAPGAMAPYPEPDLSRTTVRDRVAGE